MSLADGCYYLKPLGVPLFLLVFRAKSKDNTITRNGLTWI